MSRMFTTTLKDDVKEKLHLLSEKTRIPQSKLIDEALEDLFKKYGHSLEKVAKKEN